jgi:dienelactone hydrolase
MTRTLLATPWVLTVLLAPLLVLLANSPSSAAIKKETVEYRHGGATLKGLLVYDDAAEGKRPGVLVFHEWWGLNDYPKRRAEQLAQLGYVAFAADMFGDGKTTEKPEEANNLATAIRGNTSLMRDRARAAFDQLRASPRVDPDRIAAIGYCFGGTVALELARDGAPVDAVVAFHAGLKTEKPAARGTFPAKVLVLHGAADTLVPPDEVAAFEKEMKDAGVAYEIVAFPGAKHAFTNPDADKHGMPPIAYQKEADEKSWAAMKEFLAEVLK